MRTRSASRSLTVAPVEIGRPLQPVVFSVGARSPPGRRLARADGADSIWDANAERRCLSMARGILLVAGARQPSQQDARGQQGADRPALCVLLPETDGRVEVASQAMRTRRDEVGALDGRAAAVCKRALRASLDSPGTNPRRS